MNYAKVFIIAVVCSFSQHPILFGQLLTDDFHYEPGTSLVSNGWSAHSASGTNPITVASGGLTYSSYPSSGIGNAAVLNGTGEDVNRTFAVQNSNVLFVSFLLRFANLPNSTDGEYFLHFGSTAPFLGRVYGKRDGSGNVAIGLAKSTEGASFSGFDYDFNTTYLVVVKYTFVQGTNNDRVSLLVFSSGVPEAEPSTPTIGPLEPATSDPSSLSALALRQGSAATVSLKIDGIRVATTWSESALPVQLISFTAFSSGLSTHLRWSTASETNNYGFEVERRGVRGQERNSSAPIGDQGYIAWIRVGFVPGSGTSSSPKEYSCRDEVPVSGRYAYRLKQVNHDGTYEYYHAAEVEVGLMPKRLELFPNVPNPFNPTTSIGFTLPENGHAVLKVFDILGREIQTMFDGEAEAGRLHQSVFDAGSLSSGIYFYRLEYKGQVLVRKMILMR
jgi:hypothetical protein